MRFNTSRWGLRFSNIQTGLENILIVLTMSGQVLTMLLWIVSVHEIWYFHTCSDVKLSIYNISLCIDIRKVDIDVYRHFDVPL